MSEYIKITTKLRADIMDLLGEYQYIEVNPDSPFAEVNTKQYNSIMRRLLKAQKAKRKEKKL